MSQLYVFVIEYVLTAPFGIYVYLLLPCEHTMQDSNPGCVCLGNMEKLGQYLEHTFAFRMLSKKKTAKEK